MKTKSKRTNSRGAGRKTKGGKIKASTLVVILSMIIFIILYLNYNAGSSTFRQQKTTPQTGNIGLPRVDDEEFLFENKQGRYVLYYDTTYRQASWVAYTLTRSDVRAKGAKRKNNFRSDPSVLERGYRSATDKDYARSGYDRGHLLPSADRDDNDTENSATFYLSNISPQRPQLNRGIWKELEEHVRRMAERYDTTYIITGGDLSVELPRMGKSRVGIPDNFYKALLVRSKGRFYAIGFYIPNAEKFSGDYRNYVRSIDELEEILDLDLYAGLDSMSQVTAERSVELNKWFF